MKGFLFPYFSPSDSSSILFIAMGNRKIHVRKVPWGKSDALSMAEGKKKLIHKVIAKIKPFNAAQACVGFNNHGLHKVGQSDGNVIVINMNSHFILTCSKC